MTDIFKPLWVQFKYSMEMSNFKTTSGRINNIKLNLDLYDDLVYLKGLNEHEMIDAPVSVLKGSLQLVVKSKKEYIERVQIKFIGSSLDVVFIKMLNSRSIRESERHNIIDESYEYQMNPMALAKGSYTFPFQFIVEPDLPETIFTCLGSRSYYVEAQIFTQDKGELKIKKYVRLIRCPLAGSLLLSDSIHTAGIWRNFMRYEISISSRYLMVGGDFKLNLRLRPFLETKMCGIDSVNIYLIQKLQCEKRCGYFDENEKQTFDITHKVLLKKLKVKENESCPKTYDNTWTINIPKSMTFNLHPSLSNRLLDELDPSGLKISHYLRIIFNVIPFEITKHEEPSLSTLSSAETREISSTKNLVETSSFNEITQPDEQRDTIRLVLRQDICFKAPVRFLSPMALGLLAPPPTYEEAIQIPSAVKTSFNPIKLAKRRISSINETYFPPAYSES